ncbi:MAG: hypothetical protein OXD42_03985 [Rhodospirillaceae bacterium]|nr:hypothetical protein [Rhodospirillaceae bacterium]MCY4238007.1 hypothetical protein [Rhodospirillaceae bacterium]
MKAFVVTIVLIGLSIPALTSDHPTLRRRAQQGDADAAVKTQDHVQQGQGVLKHLILAHM